MDMLKERVIHLAQLFCVRVGILSESINWRARVNAKYAKLCKCLCVHSITLGLPMFYVGYLGTTLGCIGISPS